MTWAPAALALGFLHGLGADHLMAIAALSIGRATPGRPGRSDAFRVALGFALGHAIFLVAGVAIVLGLGWSIPPLVERAGETAGGALLVALGLAGIFGLLSRRFYGHVHRQGTSTWDQWHLHIGHRDHHPTPGSHSVLPTLLGAAFAVSSLRTLALLAPFGDGASDLSGQSLLAILALIVIFAAGILLSMCLFGIVLARFMSSNLAVTLGRGSALLTALGSIGLGLFWMFGRGLS